MNPEVRFCACVCVRCGWFCFLLGFFVFFEGRVEVNLVVGVDPQLERHSSSELVPFVSGGNVVGVDLALDVDVLVGSDVQELDSDQRLRVVHLQRTNKVAEVDLTTGSGLFQQLSLDYRHCFTCAFLP